MTLVTTYMKYFTADLFERELRAYVNAVSKPHYGNVMLNTFQFQFEKENS